jgi:hypothetical protein
LDRWEGEFLRQLLDSCDQFDLAVEPTTLLEKK